MGDTRTRNSNSTTAVTADRAPTPRLTFAPLITHDAEMPPSRSRKRERASAEDYHECGTKCGHNTTAAKKGSTAAAAPRPGKAAARPAAGTNADNDTDGDAPDYSLMSVWDKRYQDGVFVEWYCGFDHVRPLFERFVPKVRADRDSS